MNTASWHRNTSLLLLSLSVDHVLGSDTKEIPAQKPRSASSVSRPNTSSRADYRQRRRPAALAGQKISRYSGLAFAEGD